jgi:hypothetical protein
MSKIQKKTLKQAISFIIWYYIKLLKKKAFNSQILNLKFPFACNPYIQRFSSMILSIAFTYFLP